MIRLSLRDKYLYPWSFRRATSTLEHVLFVAVLLSRHTHKQFRVIARVFAIDTTFPRLKTEFARRFIQGVLSVARSKVPSFSPSIYLRHRWRCKLGILIGYRRAGYLPGIPTAPARWPESKSPPSYTKCVSRVYVRSASTVKYTRWLKCTRCTIARKRKTYAKFATVTHENGNMIYHCALRLRRWKE